MAFADLLAVRLSDGTRWELVERAALPVIETEWTLKGSFAAGRAETLRVGALARADLIVECTVSEPGLEHPWARLAVIETARAELLAERKIPLQTRPTGSWYRSPPEADVVALADAARDLLANAGERLAEWEGRPVAALIMSPRGSVDQPALDELATTARAKGFRWVNLVPGAAAEAEGLLHLLGYTEAKPSPWEAAADVYLWIARGPDGGAVLHSWRPGLPVRAQPLPPVGSDALVAIADTMQTDLRTVASAPSPAERLAVARGFLDQARTLWREAGSPETPRRLDSTNDFRLHFASPGDESLATIRDLLAAAAFFALEDREIQ